MINSRLHHNAPASGYIKYWLARCWYAVTGWELVGELPEDKRFVFIGAHHTSNWDFPFALCACFLLRLKVSWMGKDILFSWPQGVIMRALGGIAINRSSHHGVVDQVVEEFNHSDQLVVLIAVEGSRSKQVCWKSGFYWIAYRAQVPIVCGYLDYSKKCACIGLTLMPSGHVEKDMNRIRDFYRGVQPKRPELITPVSLKDEADFKT